MTLEQWIASTDALLELDTKGALAPHGIGGHARTLLEQAKTYLASSPSPSMEMEVVAWLDETVDAAPGAQGVTTDPYAAAYWEHTSGAPMTELVRADQAQSALAAMRAERDEADNALVDKYRDPKTGSFLFPTDVAAIVRRLDEREARIKALEEAIDSLPITDHELVRIHNRFTAVETASFPSATMQRLIAHLMDLRATRSALKENAL